MAIVSHLLPRKRFYFRTVSIQQEASVMQYCPIQCLFDFSTFLRIRKKNLCFSVASNCVCRAYWLILLRNHWLCLDTIGDKLVLTKAALLITFLISFQESLLKLLRVTKDCYSFKNKQGKYFFWDCSRASGESCSLDVLSFWKKAKRSLFYPKSEDNQQIPERSCRRFMLSDTARSYLGWQISISGSEPTICKVTTRKNMHVMPAERVCSSLEFLRPTSGKYKLLKWLR